MSSLSLPTQPTVIPTLTPMSLPASIDLHNAVELFLTSLTQGGASLESFESSWSNLGDDLQVRTLDRGTAVLAHAAASRVEALASGFLTLKSETNALMDELMADVQSVLGQLNLSDVSPPPPLQTFATNYAPSTTTNTTSSTCPPYIAPAYKWLLKNIRNPYPSKETKELISRGTGTSLQNIDAWFLNARRRIGWTSISKKYFGSSKADTIAAAFRALNDDIKSVTGTIDDEAERAPLPANIQMAFVEMEDAAKRLYSEKFTKSELAGTLDRMVKDMTDGDKKRRRDERKKLKALEKLKGEREREDKRNRDAHRRWKEAEEGYPSPSPEPESSKRRFETPSSVDSQDEEDLTPPLPIAGRKRTSSQDSGDEREAANERPAKKSRYVVYIFQVVFTDRVN